jgi:hypothetical protein
MANTLFSTPHEFETTEIAQMSLEEMSHLSYDAMIDVVLASGLPVRNIEGIRAFEGETVSRLAHMAREHCRRNVASA